MRLISHNAQQSTYTVTHDPALSRSHLVLRLSYSGRVKPFYTSALRRLIKLTRVDGVHRCEFSKKNGLVIYTTQPATTDQDVIDYTEKITHDRLNPLVRTVQHAHDKYVLHGIKVTNSRLIQLHRTTRRSRAARRKVIRRYRATSHVIA